MTMEAKGWPGRKFYLSNEAFALLKAHCEGTPLTMSAYLDGLIKAQLDSPAERFLRTQDGTLLPLPPADPAVAELQKSIDDARQQINDAFSLSKPVIDPSQRNHPKERALGSNRDADGFEKQPAKKDFKIDL